MSEAPASAATCRPAASLPVSETARTAGCAMSSPTARAGTSSVVNAPSGKPAVAEGLLEGERAAGHVRGVLEHDRVPRGQRGRGAADHLPEGEVPGHDREHHARAGRSARSSRRPRWPRARARAGRAACSANQSQVAAHFSTSASAWAMGLPISWVMSVAWAGEPGAQDARQGSAAARPARPRGARSRSRKASSARSSRAATSSSVCSGYSRMSSPVAGLRDCMGAVASWARLDRVWFGRQRTTTSGAAGGSLERWRGAEGASKTVEGWQSTNVA